MQSLITPETSGIHPQPNIDLLSCNTSEHAADIQIKKSRNQQYQVNIPHAEPSDVMFKKTCIRQWDTCIINKDPGNKVTASRPCVSKTITSISQQRPTQEIITAEPQVNTNIVNDMPSSVINEKYKSQAQLINSNSELDLDESVLLLDDTQEYSTHEGPSGLSFGEPLKTAGI